MIQDNCRTLIDVQEIDNNWSGMESSWPDQWASTLQADRRLFKQIERIIPCETFLTKSSHPRKLRGWFSVSASSSKRSEAEGSRLYCRYLDGTVVRTMVPKNVARMGIAGTTQLWVRFTGQVLANFLRGVSMSTPISPWHRKWYIEEETFRWCFHQTKLYYHKFCPKILIFFQETWPSWMIVSSLSTFYHLPYTALRIDNNMQLLKIP